MIRSSPRTTSALINWAHAIDHYAMLIFPTAVLAIGPEVGLGYGEMIGLSTACFVAFGVFALPAGWLGDHWSRRNMMAVFFLGCGVMMIATGLAPNGVWLAVSLFLLGVFAAIYHPVGVAMLIAAADPARRGRALATNGVAGNLGAALAAVVTATIAALAGWRVAFIAPGVVSILSGFAFLALVREERATRATRSTVAEVPLDPRLIGAFVGLFAIVVLFGGLVFNAVSIALPKIVDERGGVTGLPLMLTGGLATAVFLCGALTQLAVGRLVERFPPHFVFLGTAALQLAGLTLAALTTGVPLLVGLALAMSGIYGQVTVNDVVIARFTADAWRGRVYAVRFFLGLGTAGFAVLAVGLMHDRGGFDLVLGVLLSMATVFVGAVMGLSGLAHHMERRAESLQAAE
ncbi:MFS transporter [Ancylobacter terrae]|uniref:MFS transporter n=1 Tax=Ancylobacter sp. sgz301288 TaxID=3342077 RepID=UPI00385EC1F6